MRYLRTWVNTLQQGGQFSRTIKLSRKSQKLRPQKLVDDLAKKIKQPKSDLIFMAAPSIRFFDRRGANKPWLCEIPDPLSRVAWQTPVIIHPETAQREGIEQDFALQRIL